LAFATAFFYGAELVKMQIYKPPDEFQSIFCVIFTAMSLGQASVVGNDAAKANTAIQSIVSLLDRQSSIDPTLEVGLSVKQAKGEVSFENVPFKYPTRPDVEVLRKFTIEAREGKTIALVGGSGSGKSTAIGLIERFYDVDSGAVNFEHIDVRKWHLKKMRSLMAIVGQVAILLNLGTSPF
jgi:ATP-binding cassette subfamily B (MDR/TAP) protein 1